MQPDAIDSELLKQLITSGTSSLHVHKAEVDALNVFPVPDGDTGTNMYLTFQSALRELNKNGSHRVADLLESAAYGALMGARGNSGVIVSQLFRGFVKALPKDLDQLSKQDIVTGLNGSASLCYQAVRKPVEGTILTVIKEMAGFATANVDKELTLTEFAEKIYQHACSVLAKTPDMLPVLKQAGVVDAGGQGLVMFAKGIVQALKGEAPDETASELIETPVKVTSVTSYTDSDSLPEEEINFQYCTEFILKGKSLDLESLKNSLNPHGDCLLVVGDENTAKIHIHTNNPGIILDFAVRMGEMFEININNMVEQSQQRLAKLASSEGNNRRIGIVAIASGDGMDRIFRSLGVQCIVNGGQTMNPSIEDLSKAVSQLNTPEIIILPNNGNIILTANHVQDLVSTPVKVVPTHSVPEGLAAVMSFSENLSLDENVSRMTEKSEAVITGEITYSVRSIKLGELDIEKGDIIGLVNGEIVTSGKKPEDVVLKALEKTSEAHSGLISIYYGSDVTAPTAQELLNRAEELLPDAEIELYYGGQPLYYYLFSIE
ncbi:MAG TPA: DAK2 domain-containing protein [Bacillota bacterium]